MNKIWTIERNSGARVQLVAMNHTKEIWRPLTMHREDFLRLLPEGGLVDEETLRIVFP
jgi:hypothetical protein